MHRHTPAFRLFLHFQHLPYHQLGKTYPLSLGRFFRVFVVEHPPENLKTAVRFAFRTFVHGLTHIPHHFLQELRLEPLSGFP